MSTLKKTSCSLPKKQQHPNLQEKYDDYDFYYIKRGYPYYHNK